MPRHQCFLPSLLSHHVGGHIGARCRRRGHARGEARCACHDGLARCPRVRGRHASSVERCRSTCRVPARSAYLSCWPVVAACHMVPYRPAQFAMRSRGPMSRGGLSAATAAGDRAFSRGTHARFAAPQAQDDRRSQRPAGRRPNRGARRVGEEKSAMGYGWVASSGAVFRRAAMEVARIRPGTCTPNSQRSPPPPHDDSGMQRWAPVQGRRGCVPRQSRRLRRGDEWTAAVDETSLAAVVGAAAREPKHRRQRRQRSRTGHVVAILARAPWSARGPGPAQHGGSMPLEEGFQVAEADERCCYLAGRGTWSGIGSGGEAKRRKICPASPPAGSGWPATQQRAISVRLPRGWRSHGVDSVESGPRHCPSVYLVAFVHRIRSQR